MTQPTPSNTETARELLDATYAGLDLVGGDLVEASERPTSATESAWVEKGEWLSLGRQVGAERLFFVENNPVIVFAEHDAGPEQWFKLFNRIWCMARPQLLFLARDGELSVYNLTKRPAREKDDESREERLLATVSTAAQVQSQLQLYRRDQIESGQIFEDKRFGYDNRADRSLIRDLKKVRKGLIDSGLVVEHAHSLIGRSIFIRYLEDRSVLIPEYFYSIASEHRRPDWATLLDRIPPDSFLPEDKRPIYPRVLADKDFTYALFEQLARDFNGDMFPLSEKERDAVSSDHLELLQKFLLGKADDSLFFFAYRFDIIPIELISSIYEEFYGVERGKAQKQGSFYTPSSLVEFVLSHTLKDEVLDRRPRVMDPACGSGIFLVETFRRLVRHRMKQVGRRLRPIELQKILREQIAGIDINPEAVRVAAFSLYLALLHYHDPRDIMQLKLPNLTYDSNRTDGDPSQRFDILVASDAFALDETVEDEAVRRRFGSACTDVVVGNPPWGDLASTSSEKSKAMRWCEIGGRSVGGKELSQAFIHRTLDLLRADGRAGLLVSTGVFFKRHEPSRIFRRQWLAEATLENITNFAAVRDTFFSGPSHKEGAIAPFASVVFEKRPPIHSSRLAYWSAKKSTFIERVQAIVLSRADLNVVRQHDLLLDDDMWKVYWWGSHRDRALLDALRLETPLARIVDPTDEHPERFCRGYQPTGTPKVSSDWLSEYPELPTQRFHRYGPFPDDAFVSVPDLVFRRGLKEVYEGTRLLIKRGITEKGNANGIIVARLESAPFCFRDSIHGIRLRGAAEGEGEILLGIIISSLTRYYLFITSGTWGMWHHEIKRETIERIPVRLPNDTELRERIVSIVRELRAYDPEMHGLFHPTGRSRETVHADLASLESKLDDAIFDLYELADSERDLIRDMCQVGLDLLYRGMTSEALKPVVEKPISLVGRAADLTGLESNLIYLRNYIDAFLDSWKRELKLLRGHFRWWAIRPDESSPMLAVVFSTEERGNPLPDPTGPLEDAWRHALQLLGQSSLQPHHANRVFIDGTVRVVTETDIVLIKRNERRQWTRSAAREDAEASFHQIIRRQHTVGTDEVTSVPTQPL